MSDLIERFCDETHAYNSISPGRAKQQRTILRRFETELDTPAHETTPRQLQAWMASLIEDGLAPSSTAAYGALIKPFYKWLWQEGLMDGDTYLRLKAVPLPRVGPQQPKPYNRRELMRFWAELEHQWPMVDAYWWGRWRRRTSPWKRVWTEAMNVQVNAIVALALDCGLRKHEIHSVSIEDIHPDNQYVIVQRGKGDKMREVPHTDASRLAVHRWLELRTDVMATFGAKDHDHPWLALDPRGANNKANPVPPMSKDRAEALMYRLGSGWEYHRFRHTCATEWLRAGMELELVARLLGHTGTAMTLRYAEIVNKDVHAAAERASAKFARAVRPPQPDRVPTIPGRRTKERRGPASSWKPAPKRGRGFAAKEPG